MTWITLSIIWLLLSCLIAGWNRKHRLESIQLNFWRSVFATAIPIPFLFAYDLPREPEFYTLSAIIGIGCTLNALALFYHAAKYNGRISILSNSITILLTFIAWLLINETAQTTFLSTPLKSTIIACIITIASISILFMRNTQKEKTGNYLPITLSIGALNAAITILGKYALPEQANNELNSKAIAMGFIIFVTQWLTCLAIMIYKTYIKKSDCFNINKYTTRGVVTLSALSVSGCIISWLAIALAPNPAYAKAITMMAAFVFLIYHRLKGIQDNANPIAGSILTACVIALILLQ